MQFLADFTIFQVTTETLIDPLFPFDKHLTLIF